MAHPEVLVAEARRRIVIAVLVLPPSWNVLDGPLRDPLVRLAHGLRLVGHQVFAYEEDIALIIAVVLAADVEVVSRMEDVARHRRRRRDGVGGARWGVGVPVLIEVRPRIVANHLAIGDELVEHHGLDDVTERRRVGVGIHCVRHVSHGSAVCFGLEQKRDCVRMGRLVLPSMDLRAVDHLIAIIRCSRQPRKHILIWRWRVPDIVSARNQVETAVCSLPGGDVQPLERRANELNGRPWHLIALGLKLTLERSICRNVDDLAEHCRLASAVDGCRLVHPGVPL
mmetsp:Transcript_21524/g.55034  ORF Transcript_21524/g.55034 Transcript_21524/m.55034 type:complete len:283 (+) Transcript_21524:543-1391(+)